MIGSIALFMIKYLCVSALLASIYLALFRDKASFISRRVSLLAIPVVAALSALVSFDVISLPTDNVVGQAVEVAQSTSETFDLDATPFVVVSGHQRSHLTIENVVYILWLCISLLLLCRMIYQLYRIFVIRRLCSQESLCGSMKLCRSALVKTPFSFLHSIYVDRALRGSHLDMVLQHEMAHIRSRHSVDRILSELYTIISWFNPVVYFISKELCAVHEYEADSAVLSGDCDRRVYKQLLFDEVANKTPSLANGFNNSLIKKRFIQMKKNYQIKGRLVRRVVTLPLVVLVLSLTSLTYVNGQSIAKSIEKSAESLPEAEKKELTQAEKSAKYNYYRLEKGQYEYVRESDFKQVRVIRHKDYTAVECALRVAWNFHWTSFLSNGFLIDPETGDQYQIHSLKGGLPLNRNLVYRNEKGSCVMITAIFPPLKRDVKRVHYIERETPGYVPGNNDGGPSAHYNLKVEKFDPKRPHVTTPELIKM